MRYWSSDILLDDILVSWQPVLGMAWLSGLGYLDLLCIHIIINKLGGDMATYILVTKLSPELTKDLKKRAEIGRKWMERVKKDCPEVKFLGHYALLGPYDFLDIYEAPDEETATKVSMISLSGGATSAESWTAIPYKKFLNIIKDL